MLMGLQQGTGSSGSVVAHDEEGSEWLRHGTGSRRTDFGGY